MPNDLSFKHFEQAEKIRRLNNFKKRVERECSRDGLRSIKLKLELAKSNENLRFDGVERTEGIKIYEEVIKNYNPKRK